MPSSSATICANVVSCPWPWVCTLIASCALPVGRHAQRRAVVHAQAEHVHVLARAGADRLGEERDADPHQLAPRPLPAACSRRSRRSPRAPAPCAARARSRPSRTPSRSSSRTGTARGAAGCAAAARRGRRPARARGSRRALDEVDGLGDAERARVRDAARGLVRVDAGHVAVRGLEVVGAGEHAEEPGRVAARLGGGVERAVVGEHVDADRRDPALRRRADPAPHHVVAREPGRHEVLRAVLHPLHRPPGTSTRRSRRRSRDRPGPCCRSRRRRRARSPGCGARAAPSRARTACGARAAPGSCTRRVSRPLTRSKSAIAPHVSIGAGCERGNTMSCSTTTSARAKAAAVAAASPASQSKTWLSVRPAVVADHRRVGLERAAGVHHRGSGSYSTSISSSASRAA